MIWLRILLAHIAANIRLYVFGALVIGLGVAIWLWLDRGERLDRTTNTLSLTRDTLHVTRQHVDSLRVDSAGLVVALLRSENGRLRAEGIITDANRRADLMQAGLTKATNQAIAAVATMSAREQKHAADMAVLQARLGVLGTSVTDSNTNRIVAALGAENGVYRDSMPGLHLVIGVLSAEAKRLESENAGLQDQANRANASSIYAEGKLVGEAQKKRFGDLRAKARKKDNLQSAAEVRAVREGNALPPSIPNMSH
jgi:hypothetical protein